MLSYIVDSVDEGVDATVAHGQDVARHPHVVNASEAETGGLISFGIYRVFELRKGKVMCFPRSNSG